MKIQIREEDHHFCIALPTALVCSKTVLRIGMHFAGKHAPEAVQNIPPEAMERICTEIRRIKRRRGSWDLVEVESADGELVKITL